MTRVNFLIIKIFCIMFLFLALKGVTAEGNLQLTGTLIEPPPCSLDEGGPAQVFFGDNVGIKKVPSGIYRQVIPLTPHCEETSLSWKMVLSIYGNSADFDADKATIVTEQLPDLGIKFFAKGKAIPLDEKIFLEGNILPDIEALLVQKEGTELKEQEFTATATLKLNYQ